MLEDSNRVVRVVAAAACCLFACCAINVAIWGKDFKKIRHVSRHGWALPHSKRVGGVFDLSDLIEKLARTERISCVIKLSQQQLPQSAQSTESE